MKLKISSKIFFCLFLTICLAFGCKDDEEIATDWISPTFYTADAKDDTLKLIVHSVFSWNLTTENKWIKLSKISGPPVDRDTIVITFEDNLSREERDGEVRMKFHTEGFSDRVLDLKQKGIEDVIRPDTTDLRLSKEAQTDNLKVQSNLKWEVTYTPDWFTVNSIAKTGSDEDLDDYNVNFSVEENTKTYPRLDSLVLEGTEFSKVKTVVYVFQDANSSFLTDSLALVKLYNATNGGAWTKKWDLSQPVSTWEGVVIDSIMHSKDKIARVTGLELNNANIVGEIPADMFDLTYLKLLWFNNNKLTGVMPSRYTEMIYLEDVRFSNNAELEGTISDNIDMIRFLKIFAISNTKFNGAIPSSIGKQTSLELIDLSNSYFTGTLPAELGTIETLKNLILMNNFFDGEIPATFKNNLYWYEWDIENMLCPQRGTGFTNCVEN